MDFVFLQNYICYEHYKYNHMQEMIRPLVIYVKESSMLFEEHNNY